MSDCARSCWPSRRTASRNRRRRRPRNLTPEADGDGGLHEAALRLLTRREHTARELERKLLERDFEAAAVADELERLAAAGLQSDERFAEFYSRERIERGDGPRKIRAALAERGVTSECIEAALAPFSDEWIERATRAASRRFGSAGAESLRERARRARFLEQRGFPADVIRRVTRHETDD